VNAIPPPITILSTLLTSFSRTSSLPDTFAPPRIATSGLTGLLIALSKKVISFFMRKPAAIVGMSLVIASTEA